MATPSKKTMTPPARTPIRPTPKLANLVSWSYSVYTAYLKCPMSVMFDKIQRIRIPEPPNVHFEKGDRVHKAAQAHVTGTGRAPAVIPELKLAKAKLDLFRKLKARAEMDWAFTKQYLPTSWFGQSEVDVRCQFDTRGESRHRPAFSPKSLKGM